MFFQLSVLICLSFSSSFRVTPSLVHPFLEGISLDVALKSLRLFIVDYSILEKADVDSERAVSFVCEPFWTSRRNSLELIEVPSMIKLGFLV